MERWEKNVWKECIGSTLLAVVVYTPITARQTLFYPYWLSNIIYPLLLQQCQCQQQAFTLTSPSLTTRSVAIDTTTSLEACRMNAKKDKRKRNRENMRKFKTGGRKGISRRKLMKKALASKARQSENEFIAKCYITTAPPNMENDSAPERDNRR